MNRGSLVVTGLLLALIGLCGCGTESQPSANPTPSVPSGGNGLPPRPATLRIQGIDPCSLLTSDQSFKLGVERGRRNDFRPDSPLEGTDCDWSTLGSRRRIGYSAGLLLNRGAEFALGSEPLRAVGGYAATSTSSALFDPQWHCYLLVDVGPGQSLLSDYSVETKDLPGMTHQRACDNAQTAAEYMLANLRAAQPGGR